MVTLAWVSGLPKGRGEGRRREAKKTFSLPLTLLSKSLKLSFSSIDKFVTTRYQPIFPQYGPNTSLKTTPSLRPGFFSGLIHHHIRKNMYCIAISWYNYKNQQQQQQQLKFIISSREYWKIQKRLNVLALAFTSGSFRVHLGFTSASPRLHLGFTSGSSGC